MRQKKVAKLIVENLDSPEPLNKGEMLAKVRYSKGMQKQPIRILESKGVTDELAVLGFTPEAAKSVVSKIMNSDDVEPNARLKAADMTFKVHGSYAPEKTVSVNVDVGVSDEDLEIAQQLLDKRKQLIENARLETKLGLATLNEGSVSGESVQGDGTVSEPVGGEV